MTTYIFLYAFLAIALGAMIWVVGTPWLTPKPSTNGRRMTQEDISKAHR
jgi:hypothetical protein